MIGDANLILELVISNLVLELTGFNWVYEFLH